METDNLNPDAILGIFLAASYYITGGKSKGISIIKMVRLFQNQVYKYE